MILMNRLPLVCLAVGSLLLGASAQETVTIPKARLEELERKEKELEKLKSDLAIAPGETARLTQERVVAPAKAAVTGAAPPTESPSTHLSPALNTLPPLSTDDTVDAMDLGNHYLADVVAADARYRKKVFKVKGEIIGFDKPTLSRNYRVLLRTPSRELRVLCTVTPPEKYIAVFTTQGGTRLTGSLPSGTRVVLLKIGDAVVLKGRCAGLNGSMIEMTGSNLQVAD